MNSIDKETLGCGHFVATSATFPRRNVNTLETRDEHVQNVIERFFSNECVAPCPNPPKWNHWTKYMINKSAFFEDRETSSPYRPAIIMLRQTILQMYWTIERNVPTHWMCIHFDLQNELNWNNFNFQNRKSTTSTVMTTWRLDVSLNYLLKYYFFCNFLYEIRYSTYSVGNISF